jgi:hypothetical protein
VQNIDAANLDEEILIKTISFKTSLKVAYVKIKAKNLGPLPTWHLGAPFEGKAWVFADEIEIK